MLGLTAFANLLNDARFAAVPMILETPKSEDMHEDVENLRVLRSLEIIAVEAGSGFCCTCRPEGGRRGRDPKLSIGK